MSNDKSHTNFLNDVALYFDERRRSRDTRMACSTRSKPAIASTHSHESWHWGRLWWARPGLSLARRIAAAGARTVAG